jgi:hypothetical protein
MKRLVAAGLVAATLALSAPIIARAEEPQEVGDMDQYEDAFSNPLRLAYYVLHPVGFTAEWLIMRPLHYLISRPYFTHLFGYAPVGEESSYAVHGERMGEHM